MTAVEHGGRLYGLGRTVWHDEASRQFPAATAPLRTVQHQLRAPVLDQGQLGSCTGNAISQALNTDPLIPVGRRVLTEDDAVAIYSWATHHDPYPGAYPPEDTGSSGLAVAKAVKHLKLISSYHHAFGLQHTLEALVLQPVIIGIPWKSTMFDVGADGYLDISGSTVGGHEVCLTGLDVKFKTVTLLNSWGPGWGASGHAFLRWADLGALLSQDGDVTVPVL